jgi:hypothetical protein
MMNADFGETVSPFALKICNMPKNIVVWYMHVLKALNRMQLTTRDLIFLN